VRWIKSLSVRAPRGRRVYYDRDRGSQDASSTMQLYGNMMPISRGI
jgi:hypothetical protein